MSITRVPGWSIRVECFDKQEPQIDDIVDRSVEKVVRQIDCPRSYIIGSSCNGLFCIYIPIMHKFSVWNPFTGAHEIAAPEPEDLKYRPPPMNWHGPMWQARGFGCDGTLTSEYKIVKLSKFAESAFSISIQIKVFTVGASNWRQIEKTIPPIVLNGNGLYVKGALHWINDLPYMRKGVKRGIVVFSLGKEAFEEEIPLPELDDAKLKRFNFRLIGGKLAAFMRVRLKNGSFDFEIWVMEEYGVKESWTKKITISGQSVGVSRKCMVPLSFLKDGKILLNIGDDRLGVYDPMNKACTTVKPIYHLRTIPRIWNGGSRYELCCGIEYVETLVPPIYKAVNHT